MSARKKGVDVVSAAPISPDVSSQPLHDAIAVRAYQFFVQRGYAHGADLDDWFQAERELLARGASPEKKKAPGRKKSGVVEMPVRRSLAS